MNPKYLHDIVTYTYTTGTAEMQKRYNLKTHEHGPFDCDIADFRKFFDQIKNGGEVSELRLITKKGCYTWKQKTKNWTYYGK